MKTAQRQKKAKREPVGNLTDFVDGADENNPLEIEVVTNDDGRVIVFHDKPFNKEVSWFEFDLESNKLDFILDGGETRDIGLPLVPAMARNMQNTHQILMVLMNDETGDADKGKYVPLILHRK